MRYKTKSNRLNSLWGPSYLYLRKHAEEQAIKQFGSLIALDEEKERRSRRKFHRNSHPSQLHVSRRVTRDARTSSPLSSSTETDRFPSSPSAKALKRRWNASTKTISSLNPCQREPDLLMTSRRSSPRTSTSPSNSLPLRSDAADRRSPAVDDAQAFQNKLRAEQTEEVKILSHLVRENTALIRNIYRNLVIATVGLLTFLVVYLLFFAGGNNAVIIAALQKRALVNLEGCMAGVSLYLDALYASIYYCTRDLCAYLLRHPLNSFYKSLLSS